uniref:Rieske domain-containing protein n=1 Tax=Heterosigma akashiwo TaxID=2829 RepID=A0A7S3XQ78_HETAK
MMKMSKIELGALMFLVLAGIETFGFNIYHQNSGRLSSKVIESPLHNRASQQSLFSSSVPTPSVDNAVKGEGALPQPPKAWVPIASLMELDPKRPTPVQFMGRKYVVWLSKEGWKVFDDMCPHRLAPLSEGRIETTTGNLQCAYHGWEFGCGGGCARVPQAHNEAAARAGCPAVPSYQVVEEKGLVWFWPFAGVAPAAGEAPTPAELLDGVRIGSTYTRDLPYGYDVLVENLLDAAHIPFAHHGMQGTRADALPINATLAAGAGAAGFTADLEDRSMRSRRRHRQAFRAPWVVNYSGTTELDPEMMTKKDKKKKDLTGTFNLCVTCIPTAPGRSRAIVTQTPSKILGKFPRWLVHALSGRFLDSDLAFLHYQEKALRRPPVAAAAAAAALASGKDKITGKFYMPIQSDISVAAFRKWYEEHGWGSALSRDPMELDMPRSALFDRYEQHTSHCVECQKGMKLMSKIKKFSLITGMLSFLASKFLALRLIACLAALSYLGAQKMNTFFYAQDYKHYES